MYIKNSDSGVNFLNMSLLIFFREKVNERDREIKILMRET